MTKYLNFGQAVISVGECFIGLLYIIIGFGNSAVLTAIGATLLVFGVFSFKFRNKFTEKMIGEANNYER